MCTQRRLGTFSVCFRRKAYPVQRLNVRRQQHSSASDLHKFVCQKIKATGPITVEEFMRLGVSAPEPLGYYSTSGVLDIFHAGDRKKGDFYTSPQMTQMLGEILAVWIHFVLTNDLGLKNDALWNLVELGPGTGELMSDVLSTLTQLRRKDRTLSKPGANLIDISPSLIKAQSEKLLALPRAARPKVIELQELYSGMGGHDFAWYKSVKDYVSTSQFSVFLAHEYLDALPVHKFRFIPDKGWREVLVDLDPDRADKLRYVISSGRTTAQTAYLSDDLCKTLTNTRDLEFSPDAAVQISLIADHINRFGGMGIFLDYGHVGDVSGDTFRAYSNHKQVDPLQNLGKCDLTADVNFAFIRHVADQKCFIAGPVTQAEFFTKMGLQKRYEILLDRANTTATKNYLEKCFHVLTDAAEMGERFKIFAMFPRIMEPYFKTHPVVGFF